jgi:hypothetical protein
MLSHYNNTPEQHLSVFKTTPNCRYITCNTQEATDEVRLGQPLVDPFAPDESRRLIGQALGGKPEVLGLRDGMVLTVAPILGEGDKVLGALYVCGFAEVLFPGCNLIVTLAILGASLIVLTVVSGIIGTFFGRVASRGLVRRLAKTINGTIIHDGLQWESISPLAGD